MRFTGPSWIISGSETKSRTLRTAAQSITGVDYSGSKIKSHYPPYFWCIPGALSAANAKLRWLRRSSIPPERRKRKCTVRSAVGCEMKLRKRFWKDGTVEISNHGTCSQHCHSMDEMDQIKRNSAVRLAIGNEIGKGYRPTEVKRVLLKNQEILAAAGGQSITIKDCHNAALTFGKESKEHSPSSKGAEQPESHESLQDDDEPMLGAMLQAHNQQEAETSEKQDFEPSTQVQAQETGQIRQASAEPASHIARSELTRDPNGKRANKRNKAVLEKQ
ncbi:hypothetical protein PRK78_004952 [Emydomyces testavorans]|uniref:Uncharacterized protein n=1 Tax=Emydomyces testavorans TaxID=2070801 RepID=A0AAF0DJE9_9EURO|nr:hypothetical protein PRK78_004952 [Emydomyces testavorans]